MPLNYKLITPPVIEPVSLLTAKQHLRVDFDDDDTLISYMISAAREMCEQTLQRAIYNQTYELYLDQFNYGDWRTTVPVAQRDPLKYSAIWDSMALRLPMPLAVSVSSITYLDTLGNRSTLDPTAYSVDLSSKPARIVPALGTTWPTTDYYIPGSVTIAYVAGSYGDGVVIDTCPQSIKLAILLLIAHLYGNREAVGKPMATLPMGVDYLLQPHKFAGAL